MRILLGSFVAGVLTAYLIGVFIFLISAPSDQGTNFEAGVGGSPSGSSVTPGNSQKNTIELLSEDGNFILLLEALKETDLIEKLSGTENYTLFAPTDQAFAKLPPQAIRVLFSNREGLRNLLLYHLVSGAETADELGKKPVVKSISGEKVNIKTNDGFFINGIRVIKSDERTSNGIIHVVDEILLPPEYLFYTPQEI